MPGGCLIHKSYKLCNKRVDNLFLVIIEGHTIIKENVCLPLVVVRVHHLQMISCHFPSIVVSVNPEQGLEHLKLLLL